MKFTIALLLAASGGSALSQAISLPADRPGTAVLTGTPKRAITDPRSLISPEQRNAAPIPIGDLLSLRSSYFAAWTPDGRDIVMATDLTGRINLWRVPSSGGFPRQLQQSEDKTFYPAISPDGKTVLFASDVGGREIYDIFAVPLDGGTTVNLTNSNDASDTGPFVFSPDGRTTLFNRRVATEPSTNVAMLTLDGAKVRLLTHEQQPGIYWRAVAFTPDGRRVIANRSDLHASSIWSIDLASGAMTRIGSPAGSFDSAAAISPDGQFLSATSENGAGIREAVLIDIATGKRTAMMPGPWPQEGRSISPDGRTVLMVSNVDGSRDLFVYDVASARARKLDLPAGQNSDNEYFGLLPAFSPDGGRLLLPYSSGSAPFDYWTYDLTTGKRTRTTDLGLASVRAQALPKSRTVTYNSADGTPISALMWMPFNLKRDGTAPVVVIAHGGPTGQTENNFDATAVALASRGYMVIAPNVRGSIGYGRAFEEANRRDLGGRDLEDEAWAAKFLVASGYADPKRIGITGGSYGGYMTLIAVSRMPDFWAAGVEEYGIVNWRSMWERGSPALREYQRGLIGDPAIDKEVYDRTSPLTYTGQVKAPLLVLQGENDIRVPAYEARQVVDTLKKAGRTVDAKFYPEEGHGFSKRENQIDALQRTVAWFDTHLKDVK
ncbi:S9 family peptidase [Sphingomonas sp. CLY1604]|uniref:S9 family peptidase n=1 Tax=Sphingomonas sp. CLY1604 TaxID=3457786 RepID=UPI003FD8918C